MVQRGPSLHLNRAGKTQQRRGTPDSLAGRTRIFGACADNRTRFQTVLHPSRRGPLLLGQHNNFVRSCDQDVPTLRPGLSSPSLAAASLCSETAGVPYRGRTCEAESPTEMTHASLHAQFVPPTDLRPQTKMHRNVPCWCGSGKKWKRCHRNRESQPPVNVREQLSGLYREFQKGYCSHPQASSENCGHRIVRAHTVQRRGGLAAIAENGHVISAKTAAQDRFRNHGAFVPREVGVGSASTFMGFCDTHDNSMFQPVESHSVPLTPESCFLLSFRAVSYELFQKRAALRSVNTMRELDRGKPFEDQCELQQLIHLHEEGTKRGLADCERWKKQYDTIFIKERFEQYRFVGVAYSSVLPVVGCGAFHPEYDFAGNLLQIVSRGDAPHEHVGLNLTVLNGRSLLVIGWTEGQKGPSELFGRSFGDVPDEEKANRGIQLAVEHIENIYMKPSWWHGLCDTIRNALVTRMRSGMPDRGRELACLRSDGHSYTTDVHVVNSIGS